MDSQFSLSKILTIGLLLLVPCVFTQSVFGEEEKHASENTAVSESASAEEGHGTDTSREPDTHGDTAHGGEEAHAAGSHAEGGHGGGQGGHPPEIPDLLFLLHVPKLHPCPPFYSILTAVFVLLFFKFFSRNLQKVPGRGQSFIESYVEIVDNFVCSILGDEVGRQFVPFIGTLWIYILCMNLFCLISVRFFADLSRSADLWAFRHCLFYRSMDRSSASGPGGVPLSPGRRTTGCHRMGSGASLPAPAYHG